MPDPIALSSDAEFRALAERALTAHYELDEELGRGGMGVVYRATDRRLKRVVAIKILPPELGFRGDIRSRFLREAQTAAQLSHPNIVPIYSVDEREGLVYFVMACVDGPTLARREHDEGRLPVEMTRRLLREVADALAYAHARGVVHRDIKPDNILVDNESGRAMVTDFGIARAVQGGADSRLTATGVAIGTPAYMSPEQAAGDREIDGRSDLYSLGIVGYQMLAGRLPFEATSTPSMLMKHIMEQPPLVTDFRPDVPPDLATAVMKLLEKEPENRFESASDLSRVLSGDPVAQATLLSTPPRVSARENRGATTDRWAQSSPTSPYPLAGRTSGESRTASVEAASDAYYTPTAEEIARWSAPEVQRFRASFARFAFVNAVIVIAAIFTNSDFLSITVIWGIFMALKYSKLWSAGYDWHDVFREPRERPFTDVLQEAGEHIEDFFNKFDKNKRGKIRDRRRRRKRIAPQSERAALPGASPVVSARPADYGPYADQVRRASRDLDEIARIVNALPRSDQSLVEGVVPAAEGLYRRAQGLAAALHANELTPGAADRIEEEIAALEAQANPLDVPRSEERVRRLALLKRERRAVADAVRRHDETAAKLESCLIALQNMRIDVLRLRAEGVAGVSQHITLLTERARSLADEVDAVVQVGAEARGAADGGRV
ncbi:MAG TPA: serine/threonine-protein kinase [Gemmatimonadaceae bacterium]|nr:serine/threonine-protein kinase [Gemmatimonadaceae bacterium]